MQFSLYAKIAATGEEVFLQTSNELTKLQKQSKYVYIRWLGEMGFADVDEDNVSLKIYENDYEHSEAQLAVPRRAWVSLVVSSPKSTA